MTPSNSGKPTSELNADAVSRLLRLGDDPGPRPVDRLVNYLDHESGEKRFERLLQRSPFQALADAPRRLLTGAPGLDELRQLREAGKLQFDKVLSEEDRLSGLAAYLLSSAAALYWHGAYESSRPWEEFVEVLADLIAVPALPEAWRKFLHDALLVSRDA